MARDHARILLSIWDDSDFVSLSSVQQRTYLALISSRDLSYCGVHPLIPVRLCSASDMAERKVSAAIDALEAKKFLIVDRDTAEVCIRTYVRHDGILKMPNVVRAMNKAWSKVHSATIRKAIRRELGVALADAYPEGIGQAMCKALAEGFGKGFVEGFAEHFSNSPSPFPLPHKEAITSSVNPYVANARDGALTIDEASR